MRLVSVLVLLGSTLAPRPTLAAQTRSDPPAQTRDLGGDTVRNPSFLRASEQLTRREPTDLRRVRFEWEQVGAAQYVLQGQWVEPGSWATRRREISVTAKTAGRWEDRLVVLELGLEPGAHSWSVVAVFPGRGVGDFANPTRLTFDVR